MKLIVIVWRDPNGNLSEERFEAEKFKVHTEQGWLKLTGEDKGVIRCIPSDKVSLVQWVEQKDEPKILRPNVLTQPTKFQPS